jgi:hypothetical protein
VQQAFTLVAIDVFPGLRRLSQLRYATMDPIEVKHELTIEDLAALYKFKVFAVSSAHFNWLVFVMA